MNKALRQVPATSKCFVCAVITIVVRFVNGVICELSTCCISGCMLGIRDTAVIKTDPIPGL